MLVLWATLFLGERPRPVGLAGVAILLVGLMLVGGADRWFRPGSAVRVTRAGVVAALSVALCISTYSTIDAAAVRRMDPAAYNVLVLGLTWVLGTPLVVARHGVPGMVAVGREHRARIVAVGLLMFAAYAMVLNAYTLAPASYAAAIREVSIVLAALVGWRWLGEGFGGLRTAGAGLIFAGIVLIAWKG
jgi:drug/metabolite transporter (DMT)-like permease